MPEPAACPCPSVPCAYSNANIRSKVREAKPIAVGRQGNACLCRACCCGKPVKVKPCYKQPEIPRSYAPERCYTKPTAPVEGGTTYKLSYLPNEAGQRNEPMKPTQNIMPSNAPMEGTTVQKLSYLPNPVCVTQSMRPCNHDMWGRGPMQQLTTQRHDFVPKPCVIRQSFKPETKFHSVDQPFENQTVNKLSYLPPVKVPMTKSFAPERSYEKPTAKMDVHTTHKTSYLPNPIMPKQPLPWVTRDHYQKPDTKIEGATIYNQSYLDAKSDCRRRPRIPDADTNPVTSSKNFETQTVYKNSYLPAKAPPMASFKPIHSLMTSTAPMEGDTVHKLSYLPVPVCPTESFRPCNHDMWGKGPMQLLTTQKHDFVPKPCVIRESFKPSNKFEGTDVPFENRTINRMSYLNPGKQGRQPSYAPLKGYEKPNYKMESQTTQKLSYQPVQAPPPQLPPWARRGEYQPPQTKVDGTTVYRSSFLPPGEDCTEYIDPCEYGDCSPCDCTCPSQCIEKDPCACAFPKAECV